MKDKNLRDLRDIIKILKKNKGFCNEYGYVIDNIIKELKQEGKEE